jgi:hypothetical protein
MEKKIKVMATFIVLVVLISGLYAFTNWFSIITGYIGGEEDSVKLAQCLDGKGAELYGSIYCPDCEAQVKLFGRAIKFISRVDCGKDGELCPNIQEIPAWYIDKKIYYGYKSFDELREISGCRDE